jgi:hypothetical protein
MNFVADIAIKYLAPKASDYVKENVMGQIVNE